MIPAMATDFQTYAAVSAGPQARTELVMNRSNRLKFRGETLLVWLALLLIALLVAAPRPASAASPTVSFTPSTIPDIDDKSTNQPFLHINIDDTDANDTVT